MDGVLFLHGMNLFQNAMDRHTNLPDDPAECRRLLLAAHQQAARLQQRVAELDRVLDETSASYEELRQEHTAVLEQLAWYKRWVHGRRREYRLEDIFVRRGIHLARTTLCDWVAAAADLLQPLYELQRQSVLQSDVMWTDDTPVKVMAGGEKGTRQGRFWTYVGDDQHPYSVYDFTMSRSQAIGRKNWLFLGSETAGPRAAVLHTILAGAKRHRIEPFSYIRELLLRQHAADSRLEELLPDRWAAEHPETVLTYRLEESRRKAATQRDRRSRRRALAQAPRR